MSASVLYEAQGPRAKARNVVYTAVFLVAAAVLLWWVYSSLKEKGQLDWAMWSPFFGSESWTTYLLPGLQNTLLAAALSLVIALPLGAVLGIARLSDHAWVRVPATVVVEFFRAIPVLILMVFCGEFYYLYTGVSSDSRPLYAVITGLVLYNASVLAEVVRAGILSLPKGQSEAAMAIGLRKSQVMRVVLLPQAVTAMLPAIVSQIVVIVKDTALGGYMMTFPELLSSATTASSFYGANIIQSLTVAAVIFIVINFALTSFASWLEKRLRRAKKSTGVTLAPDGGADQSAFAAPGV
ncbi:amino acid ABC transporter permease [Streptomyces abyssomicinicus]|uniref:amino acid ABC transporter permease n=1 Tax=Streptomyces abyssomicinicus TaxID=574929 RepID=UPI001250A491|nr:amino acid ABC transporter permease [Streptomyces abyssomicinicus]